MAPIKEYLPIFSFDNLLTRSPSPTTLEARAPPKPPPKDPNYKPGIGTINPHKVPNRAFFALFALLGVAMVLTAIWFFFWAKNGGFKFRKGDWDDYKSTVLRRKGPNGTTLSGATRTTKLGGGSIVAEAVGDREKGGWKRGEQKQGKGRGKPKGNKNNEDADVRAYRHEKPAKVGGLNREADGIVNQDFAYSEKSYSDDISQGGGYVPINTPKKKKDNKWARATADRATESPVTPRPQKKKNFPYANAPGSNASTDSHRPLRPNAQPPSTDSTPTRSRNSSPRKSGNRGSVPGSFYTDPLDFESRYSASDAGMTEDSRGTKAYFHPIPGLGSDRGWNGDGGNAHQGFRRGRGRRDSLSDSEGETVMS